MANGKSTLKKFDNREVVATTIAITNAGDGLSKALAIEAQEFHHGDRVYVVLETEVSKVTFIPSKDDPSKLIRTHTLKAGVSTIVDAELVKGVLEDQRDRLDAAAGIQRIDFADGDGPALDEF